MPTLNWIGKDAVVKHHNDVPYRLLEPVPALSLPSPAGRGAGGEGEPAIDPYQGNLIVQGDNLQALKALLPHYGGKVKCIYIDPPYNTGNEGWAYNDNVNSPEIRRWLGEVVGKEGDTLDRHDRWLCMMYPRLMLLKSFLRQDGLIFISIDDNEQQNLRSLLDEIFGRKNFVAQFVWNTEGHTDNQFSIKVNHEYIVAYALNIEKATFGYVVDPNTRQESNLWAGIAENSITKNGAANPPSEVELPIGFPVEVDHIELPSSEIPAGLLKAMIEEKLSSNPLKRRFGAIQFPLRLDKMKSEKGKLSSPCRVFSGWANVNKLRQFIKNECQPIDDDGTGFISFYLSKKGVIYYKKVRGEKARNIVSVLRSLSTTEKMRSELERMGIHFQYPKPKELISYLLSIGSESGDLIMDSFAGSGTTGHAALTLTANKSERRFILVEIDKSTAEKVTARRLENVIRGYEDTSKTSVPGLGGSFHFCRLGQQLFDARGHIDPNVRFGDLARFVWFQETGQPLSAPGRKGWSPLLGVHRGRAVYLLYNGILKDRAIDGGNVLTSPLLAELPAHDGPRVVYGARCVIGADRLRRLDIAFKQLPYDLRVSR
jgi:adenine-specific DNA-methyltransferase